MSNEDRIRALFAATPAQLAAIDAALAGRTEPPTPCLRTLGMVEAARETGVSRFTLWRAIRDGRLRTVEIRAGSRRIPLVELQRLIAGQSEPRPVHEQPPAARAARSY
jgi:excisionase family DNA binding protein